MALPTSFAATGRSEKLAIKGSASLSISGVFVATVRLERSFDQGVTWHVVASFTAPFQGTINGAGGDDTLYSLNVSAYTSGTVVTRVG